MKRLIFIFLLLITSVVFASDKLWWFDEAGFYESNYPNCSSNEKALMFIDALDKEHEQYSVSRKVYKVEVIYIYKDGRQLWPIKRESKKSRNTFELLKETFKNTKGEHEDIQI